MSTQDWIRENKRLSIGAVLISLGALALYNTMWYALTFQDIDWTPWRFELLNALWQTSVITLLLGLLALPPGRIRVTCWCAFVCFVLATGIHAVARDLYFDTRYLWW